MNAVRKRRLSWLLFFVAVISIATALISYALRQNISLFYTPSELLQTFKDKTPIKQNIRLGGMVQKGSVQRGLDDLNVVFELTDYKHSITVHYRGILPDLFREGQGIVTRGHMVDKNNFQAVEVLAKHDANYMPAQLKRALAKA